MKIRTLRVILLAVAVMLVAATQAYAAEPSLQPRTLVSAGFESPADQPFTLAPTAGISTAQWGRVRAPNNPPQGSWSLWCAGALPSGMPSSLYPYYPDDTAGNAELNLTQLADYYGARISVSYLCPSRGAADESSFIVNFWGLSTPSDAHPQEPGDVTSWTRLNYDLWSLPNKPISRDGAHLVFRFADIEEAGGQTGGDPFGPALDDFQVSAYKYGPVDNLQANVSGTNVALSWEKPNRTPSPSSNDDERTLAYRVWRKPHLQSTWTEVTSNRISATSFTDTSVAAALYDYFVQAWDTGTGSDYGISSTIQATVPDTIAPFISYGGVAKGATYRSPVTPTFSATDNVGVTSLTATLNGKPFVSGTTVTDSGIYTLVITAKDSANNTSAETIPFTIELPPDTEAPEISYAGVTDRGTYTAPVTPTFSATDDVYLKSLSATLNGAAFASGSAVTAPGGYTLVITARDVSDNAAVETIAFTIQDVAAPSVAYSGVSTGGTYTSPVTPVFSASDNVGVTLLTATLNGAPFVSDTQITALGEYVLVITARDATGNTKVETVSFAIHDAVAPVIFFDGVAKGGSYKSAVAPVFAASDNVGVTLLTATLNGAPFVSGTPIATSGSFTLVITARDARNNIRAETIAFTIAIPKPKVSLGTPVAPKTMKKSKPYAVYGSLKPRYTSGTVRIYKEKYVKTKVKGKVKWTWKKYGHVNAKIKASSPTASKYSVKMSLTSKGTWRLRAYAPTDSEHVAIWSSKYDKVTVK